MKGYILLYFLRASNYFNIPYFKILSHYVHALSWKIDFLESEKGMKIDVSSKKLTYNNTFIS